MIFMKQTLLLFFFLLAAHHLYPQADGIRQKNFNVKNNVALQGYDPVSYFNGNPQEGSDRYTHTFKGITYYFLNPANRDKFRQNPAAYEPAYGGWCAYAMGENGEKVKIDPDTYKIIDNRLYLFYNFWGTNTLESWNKKERLLKQSADQNWQKVI